MELVLPDDELEYDWVTPRIAVGRTIVLARNMRQLAADGVTHVLSLETGFDDTRIVGETGITVCWLPQPDDLKPKPPEWFEKGVSFIENSLSREGTRVYVHCIGGIQRGPAMLLAYLGSTGLSLEKAQAIISSARPVVQFPEIYVQSVDKFLRQRSR